MPPRADARETIRSPHVEQRQEETLRRRERGLPKLDECRPDLLPERPGQHRRKRGDGPQEDAVRQDDEPRRHRRERRSGEDTVVVGDVVAVAGRRTVPLRHAVGRGPVHEGMSELPREGEGGPNREHERDRDPDEAPTRDALRPIHQKEKGRRSDNQRRENQKKIEHAVPRGTSFRTKDYSTKMAFCQ